MAHFYQTRREPIRVNIYEIGKSKPRLRSPEEAGPKWEKETIITYCVHSYPSPAKVTPDEVDEAIGRAFQTWGSITSLEFVPASRGTADIEIDFLSGSHAGDDYDFDGRGGVLAHTEMPDGNKIVGETMHFDEAEAWTVGTNKGTNLYQVALHEIGHALGLEHNNDPNSIMYAYTTKNTELSDADIRAVQEIHGPQQ